MLGIHLVMASHKLNVSSTSRPIWKKIRRFHSNKQKIIWIKIEKLLAIGFIKEVKCPDWLANVMVVPKKYERWEVYIDYTNLNDTCLKDSFLLPWID